MNYGPNTVTDGLAFAIDFGNRKSYRIYQDDGNPGVILNDQTANQNNGTLTNIGFTFDTGNGGSFDFDGSDDYIDFGQILEFSKNQSFSYTCWFNQPTDSGAASIMGRQSASPVYRGPLLWSQNNKIYWRLKYDGSESILVYNNTAHSTDVWNHIVATYDGSSNNTGLNLYLNGSLVTNVSRTGTISNDVTGPISFNIGANNSNSNYFDGKIAVARVYNKELSAAEALQNYKALTGRFA